MSTFNVPESESANWELIWMWLSKNNVNSVRIQSISEIRKLLYTTFPLESLGLICAHLASLTPRFSFDDNGLLFLEITISKGFKYVIFDQSNSHETLYGSEDFFFDLSRDKVTEQIA